MITEHNPSELTHVSEAGEIILASGKWFNVFKPNPDDIELKDIAHALANQCRFTGHVKEFYSVAEHSVLVSQYCLSSDAKWGLLHDASEAYLSDIARPIKKHPDFGPFYLEAEERVMNAICEKFEMELEMPTSVKEADDMLLRMEARDLMPETFPVYPGETASNPIICWNPRQAYGEFIVRSFEVM